MEILSAQFLSALLAIVVIDLVLAGDNAIVIALAARSLPATLQKRAIVWGTVGAIVVRSALTVVAVWLLKIPGLMLVGGLMLVWIAWKLLVADDDASDDHGPAATTFFGAMKTIVIADAIMGLDNVLGVAGAAHGNYLLVVLGLLISIPIVIWGSTMILKLVDRYAWIVYVGAGVLAWTAAKMVLGEPVAQPVYADWPVLVPAIYLLFIGGLLGGGWWRNRSRSRDRIAAAAQVADAAAAAAVGTEEEGDTRSSGRASPHTATHSSR
ncbi:MAG: TerC family protein [Lautropia sp.]